MKSKDYRITERLAESGFTLVCRARRRPWHFSKKPGCSAGGKGWSSLDPRILAGDQFHVLIAEGEIDRGPSLAFHCHDPFEEHKCWRTNRSFGRRC